MAKKKIINFTFKSDSQDTLIKKKAKRSVSISFGIITGIHEEYLVILLPKFTLCQNLHFAKNYDFLFRFAMID